MFYSVALYYEVSPIVLLPFSICEGVYIDNIYNLKSLVTL